MNPPFVQNRQNRGDLEFGAGSWKFWGASCTGDLKLGARSRELGLWWVGGASRTGIWVLELRLCQIRALHRLKFTAKGCICSSEQFLKPAAPLNRPRIPTPRAGI